MRYWSVKVSPFANVMRTGARSPAFSAGAQNHNSRLPPALPLWYHQVPHSWHIKDWVEHWGLILPTRVSRYSPSSSTGMRPFTIHQSLQRPEPGQHRSATGSITPHVYTEHQMAKGNEAIRFTNICNQLHPSCCGSRAVPASTATSGCTVWHRSAPSVAEHCVPTWQSGFGLDRWWLLSEQCDAFCSRLFSRGKRVAPYSFLNKPCRVLTSPVTDSGVNLKFFKAHAKLFPLYSWIR